MLFFKKNKGLLSCRVFKVTCYIVAGTNPPKTTNKWVNCGKPRNYFHVDKKTLKDGEIVGEIYILTDDTSKITKMYGDGIISIEQVGHGHIL